LSTKEKIICNEKAVKLVKASRGRAMLMMNGGHS
jgi:hypothetical protein